MLPSRDVLIPRVVRRYGKPAAQLYDWPGGKVRKEPVSKPESKPEPETPNADYVATPWEGAFTQLFLTTLAFLLGLTVMSMRSDATHRAELDTLGTEIAQLQQDLSTSQESVANALWLADSYYCALTWAEPRLRSAYDPSWNGWGLRHDGVVCDDWRGVPHAGGGTPGNRGGEVKGVSSD